MSNCLNCGKELTQTPGKKEKKYCDAKCKQQHWHKLKAEKKDMVKISREEYELLLKGNFKNPVIIKESKTDKHLPGLTAGMKQVKVKELDKEGSKPYKPKESNESNLTYLKKRQQQKLK